MRGRLRPASRAGMDPQERRGEGSLLISRARATRTLRRCSLDARSGSPSRPPSCEGKTSKLGGRRGAAWLSSCSWNAHDRNVLVRHAQSWINQVALKEACNRRL